MKALRFILFLTLFLAAVAGRGQTVAEGYIISVEDGTAYIDLTAAQVAPGHLLEVYAAEQYMTHPVTGKRIRKKNEKLGTLEVGEVYDEYSVARPVNPALAKQLKAGMRVRCLPARQQAAAGATEPVGTTAADEDRIPIVIAPAVVNDVVNNGHFGGYVADILMEQMLACDRVRLLDRSVLGAQMDELNLSGSLLDPSTTISRGKAVGARYILQTTMQKPDVANVRTGVPLASIMGAIQGATGVNIGAGYASNMNFATLRAAVTLSVRVVDLETGEVVFMSSGNGEAKGKVQLGLEYGALGGGEINGGADGFKQTVTGQAIQKAFRRIGRNLNAYFEGRTDKKVVGTMSGGALGINDRMYARGYRLYLGTERLDKEGIQMAFSEQPDLFFQYKKAKRKKAWAFVLPLVGTGLTFGMTPVMFNADNTGAAVAGITICMGVVPITGGIVLGIRGKRQIKRIADRYNAAMMPERAFKSFRPKSAPYLTLGPTGIRLNF